MRRRSSKRGYTAVEVLIAMTLFAIGAAGVIGMQRTIVQGGNDARHFDLASNIAHMVLARLQQDAMGWTAPNQNNAISNLPGTRYLNVLGTSCGAAWCQVPVAAAAPAAPFSGAFDMWGRDVPTGTLHEFCAQYKVNLLAGTTAGVPGTLIKAEVRVIWGRIDRRPVEDCTLNPLPGGSPDAVATMNNYHSVYAATTVRPNTWQ